MDAEYKTLDPKRYVRKTPEELSQIERDRAEFEEICRRAERRPRPANVYGPTLDRSSAGRS